VGNATATDASSVSSYFSVFLAAVVVVVVVVVVVAVVVVVVVVAVAVAVVVVVVVVVDRMGIEGEDVSAEDTAQSPIIVCFA